MADRKWEVDRGTLITLMCNAYDAGFDRAAKDGVAGFHPDHVKRCKADGRKMAEAVLALADAERERRSR